ncbi:MAG TPA: DUF5682 family protein [Patescibacteria group bacterium]|nr:DUF5682 family protein [Patescibacteria group bacterium]
MAVHIFGVRHHGPGSARNLLQSLQQMQPDILLIEGPPEGECILEWSAHADMRPPVAMLAYVPDNPQKAVYYPFTEYSPEWNAIQYSLSNRIPVRFMDMSLVHLLAESAEESENDEPKKLEEIRRNPLQHLASIAGFDDAEEWWEQQFELYHYPTGVFEAVAASMRSLREVYPLKDNEERLREAFMRNAIRKAEKEGFKMIAVVCGAWHVPALENMPKAKEDNELLKNLPKVKVETTWIPWTNDRLSFESGYGAGVDSPGWYEHVWQHPDDNGVQWLSKTAGVFRANKTDISSAHIIEAVRLSEALTSIRKLLKPGLKEHLESTQTVMCMGEEVKMRIIWKELIVGKKMGSVPEDTPQVPLQRDFEKSLKSLRLKISPDEKLLSLDLRQPDHLQKSILLHRLQLLKINWGTLLVSRSKGTFKEEWKLVWTPEMVIRLLEKAVWGNTIEMAANRFLENLAKESKDLGEITGIVEKALPAELHKGIRAAMRRMDKLAASTSDTQLLMTALIPLVHISRYGNVRNVDAATIEVILDSIFYRILSNLPPSCSNIDEEQGRELSGSLRRVNEAIFVLDNPAFKEDWQTTLLKIAETPHTEAVCHGTISKILYDTKAWPSAQAATEFSKALSANNDPAYSANWIEGFLKDGATTLLFDDAIWEIINSWLAELPEETFLKIIPLLRRTFADYTTPEKKKIALKTVLGKSNSAAIHQDFTLNRARGEKVFPVIRQLLGIS